MTKKLFHDDPYMTECKAKVVSISGNEVVVDQTVFFAFAGGQASDRGTIDGIPVIEARDGEDIVYVLEFAPSFAVGDEVDVVIDTSYREAIRRLHSAAHVVIACFEKQTDIHDFIGSNVEVGKARFDFEYPESCSGLLPELEKSANDFIAGNHPVTCTVDDKGMVAWESKDISMHCCGTHVRNTSEIGPVKLKRKNIGSGKERIEIKLTG